MAVSQGAQATRLLLQELVTNKPLREEVLWQTIITSKGFRSRLLFGVMVIRNLPFLENSGLPPTRRVYLDVVGVILRCRGGAEVPIDETADPLPPAESLPNLLNRPEAQDEKQAGDGSST